LRSILEEKSKELKSITENYVLAVATEPATVAGKCNGSDIVVSYLENQFLLTTKTKPSFRQVDLQANLNILNDVKIFNRNAYDKCAFYLAVMEEDTIVPHVGETRLKDYAALAK
jgi:hypothetical protein